MAAGGMGSGSDEDESVFAIEELIFEEVVDEDRSLILRAAATDTHIQNNN